MSKILVFSKSWKRFSWKIEGREIEQVKNFRYLGILFQYNLKWTLHRDNAILLAKNKTQAITRFYYQKGNQYVPMAIRIFLATVMSRLLYGIPVWIQSFNKEVERMTAAFLRRSLGVPNSVAYFSLCAELGLHSIEAHAWISTIK